MRVGLHLLHKRAKVTKKRRSSDTGNTCTDLLVLELAFVDDDVFDSGATSVLLLVDRVLLVDLLATLLVEFVERVLVDGARSLVLS